MLDYYVGLLFFIIIAVLAVWVFYDAPKYKINRYFSVIGIVIAPLIGLILYLLITRAKIRNMDIKLLTIAVAVKFILTFLFPQQHEHMKYVYLYGFPYPFFTLYSREFQILNSSSTSFSFSFDPLQMIVNVLILYLLVWIFYKLISMALSQNKA